MYKPLRDQHTAKNWKELVARSIQTADQLQVLLGQGIPYLENIIHRYPMRINEYYLGLMESTEDPIYMQCVPDPRELQQGPGMVDPLAEEKHSPVPGLTHRYPDRVLFLVSNECAVYCRFCNRKRKVGRKGIVTPNTIREGIAYIKANRQVRDVLLSGGDPFLLETEELEEIIAQLRDMPHIEIIRIGSRVPCTLPQRITPRLVRMISKYHPVYINTHFNHPREITAEASRACALLADAGIPLGCQTVLLKGVNDNRETMALLMRGLVKMRVRPYYLFQCDQAKGTSHFWTHPQKGVDIIASLIGHTSGICVPHYCIDLPGGGGKILHMPTYVEAYENNALAVRNFEGKRWRYPIYEFIANKRERSWL